MAGSTPNARPHAAMIALRVVSAGKLQVRQRSDGLVHHDSAMVEDFLELSGGFRALIRGQLNRSYPFPARSSRG